MPRIVREADIRWEGNLARGEGSLSAATSGAFSELGYSLPTRIGATANKTSPEELLAAAHGGCFTMSLAGELTGAGTPPGRLDVHCRITMDEVEGAGHEIVHSAITAVGVVPGVDAAGFADAVDRAHAGCSFSTLLRKSGAGVDVTATLEEAV
ncbi:MAG: OsmC family peroxiredoxin [Gaiella sp.]